MNEEVFEVEINLDNALAFAQLSGDWNPLHTDEAYASKTIYKRPVLHGAYAAGLISRMAGMFLPGTECLLHNIRLNFLSPIIPPTKLEVAGAVISKTAAGGNVDVRISDKIDGRLYVSASYSYGLHKKTKYAPTKKKTSKKEFHSDQPVILVTGANGGLGSTLVQMLENPVLGVSRSKTPGLLHVADLEEIETVFPDRKIAGIVHCAWPKPDNVRLINAKSNGVDYQVASPMRQSLALARLLVKRGQHGAPLVLVGSSYSVPGRHTWRYPLYSLSKSMLPTLTQILATELAYDKRRCFCISFDVIDGGMQGEMSERNRISHADRNPFGVVPSLEDAARQIVWALENSDTMITGAHLSLTGSSLP